MSDRSKTLTLRGIHKSFGPTPVLRGVDLDVPAGSIVAILGSSGSGKTTLLRIIAGLDRPDAGSVSVGTRVLTDKKTNVAVERRSIGYVSQEGSLFPHLDVRANVGFGLTRRHRRSPKVDELLGLVGIEDLGARYPHELSGGQQQRVAVARALATMPRVVLLDEPFSSLDAALRASVRNEVSAALRHYGTTTVLVTHDQDEALSIADVVAVLREGRIVQTDTPRDLYNHPVDAEVATFVGDANLVSGVADAVTVATPLGPVPMCRTTPTSVREDVIVLLRPEQLEITSSVSAEGVPARVLSVEFHGHDETVRLAPESPELPSPLIARVTGVLDADEGDMVKLIAKGPVQTWPVGGPPEPTPDLTQS